MKKHKTADPLLRPMYPADKRAEELRLLAELSNPDSEYRKKMLADGRYKILNPKDVDRQDVIFADGGELLEELGQGDGNFRTMKTSEAPEIQETASDERGS